jgi:membrane-anchored glycerophosphoryl diester phosphodiesterase (GDPDase)
MAQLGIIGTVRRSFSLVNKDPALIALFILPALFPIDRMISNGLMLLILVGSPGPSSMRSILLLTLYFVIGFLLGVWASAGAILKVTELQKGSKIGLQEALSKGLERVPKLLVPAVVGLVLYVLMIVGMTIAVVPYTSIGVSSPVQDVGSSSITLRVAMGLLFIIVLYFATRLRLYAPACVTERHLGLKRSWKLVKGNWWKLFAILLIFGAMATLIGQIPVVGVYLRGMIVDPLTIIAVTLVYFQLRQGSLSGEEH